LAVVKLDRLTENESLLVGAEILIDVKRIGCVVGAKAVTISVVNITSQETAAGVEGLDKKMDILISINKARYDATPGDQDGR
jgi:hypothetical protein